MFGLPSTTWHKIGLSLALVAMLAHVSTVIAYGQGQSISSTRNVQTGLLTMVICSPTGLKQITIDDHGNIVDEKTPTDNRMECPFSIALSSNNLIAPPQAAVIRPPVDHFHAHPFSSAAKQLATLSFLAIPGRGPPV